MSMRRPYRPLVAAMLALCAVDGALAAPLGLAELVAAVLRSSPAYLENQTVLERYRYDYMVSRAALFPVISLSVPASYSDGIRQVLPGGTELKGNYTGSIGPRVSLSQLLPTAGVLSASVSDTVAVQGLASVSPESAAILYPTGPRYGNRVALAVGISQPLYFGGAYEAARRMIEGTRETGEVRYANGRNTVLLELIGDYYALKGMLNSVSLIKSRLHSDTRDVDRTEKELALGRGTQSTVLAARAALLKSETDLLEAQLGYDTSFRRFKAVLGLEEAVEIDPAVLPFRVPELDEETVVALAASSNPSIRTARLLRDMKKAEIVTAGKDNAPTISLEAGVTLDRGLEDNEATDQSVSLSVGLNAKLSDGGAFRNAMKRRAAELAERESALRSAVIQAEADARALLDVLRRLGKLHELYLLQEQVAQNEYAKAAKNRELGNATDKDVRTAQLELEGVRMSIHQNTIDTNLTYLRILAIQGSDVAEVLPEECVQ